ncbi:MAG TPA: hypothetical protein VF263_04850 [Longimicrobiaceae bacterium]
MTGILLALGSVSATASIAAAQTQTSTVQALAVLEQALSGAAMRDLEFGTITPGASQTVTPQNAQACAGCASGLWSFTNLSSSNNPNFRYIRVTFLSLPATLSGPGGATLPLNWTNAARGCVVRNGTELGCETGTPVNGAAYSYPINGPAASAAIQPGTTGRDLLLYLGGTATPTASQRAGNYTGTITIRFEYSNS